MQPCLSGDFIQWRAGSDYIHTRTLTYIYRCIKKKANYIVPVGRLYDSLKCASHLLTATFWEVQSCVCVGRSDVSESLRCCRKPCSFHTSSGRTNQNPSMLSWDVLVPHQRCERDTEKENNSALFRQEAFFPPTDPFTHIESRFLSTFPPSQDSSMLYS